MPHFAEKVELAVDALNSNPSRDVDENQFIEASRLVYDGVREIRQAVLASRASICLNIVFYIFGAWQYFVLKSACN